MSIIAKTEIKTSLNNARIGYKNLLSTSATVEARKMLTANTYERYRPLTGLITVRFQLATASLIDYVAIGAHNAGTHDNGVDILVQYSSTVAGALTTIRNMQFSDNQANMILFDAVTAAEIAITFNAATVGLELGVIYSGVALEMERSIYGGHSPIDLAAKTKYQSVMSDSGQFLGRNIVRQGAENSFSWKHLTPSFYRNKFQPFVEHAKKLPFFIMWRPSEYSTASFGYTSSDIVPSNMGGGNDLMQVDIKFNGHADTL